MQSRTAAFIAAADAGHTSPIVLVRALLSGGTRYWTSLGGTYGGTAYTEYLTQGLDVQIGLDALGRALRGFGRLTLANASDGGASRLSDLFATDIVGGRAVEVDLLLAGLTHPTDSLPLFRGMLEVPGDDAFDDQALRLTLLDDGNPVWAGIQDLACARVHKILGDRIVAGDYPDADLDVLGRVKPILYGALTDVPALAVDAGAADLLKTTHTAAVTTITCSDATRFAQFPSSGTVIIDSEQITYTGKGTLTLTGCTRGAGGTSAAIHPAGSTVYEKKTTYTYLVSARKCKSVSNVRVDGVLKTLTTDYTVDLTGPTYITFTARPKTAPTVTVQSQPVFTPTTTSEQSPGSVMITAEQSPGSVTVGTEHGHSTATGSHDHSQVTSLHEYPTTPSLPLSLDGTPGNDYRDVEFANQPATGYSANWHIHVYAMTGAWELRHGDILGSNTLVASLSLGHMYFTEASPSDMDEYFIAETSSGTITLYVIERDIMVGDATAASAATGVSASRSGATAASMASLAGATAANMASLSGSTAISLSQTVNTVISGADLVIGSEVLCDVEGEPDDGSGTYTGTPNALITNPADQIRHILAVHLGLTLATWADSTAFTAARAAFAAASIAAAWGVFDQIDSAELLERLRWSVAVRMFQGAAGPFKLFVLPLSGASVKTLTEGTDVPDEDHGGGPIRVGWTPLTALYNQVFVLYGKRLNGDGYAGYATATDATSISNYRMTRTLIIEDDFVRDATAAQAVADKYLAWHKDQKARATLAVDGIECAHLEPCDKISLTSPRMPGGGWSAKAFWIENIGLRIVPAGQKSAATLVCREA